MSNLRTLNQTPNSSSNPLADFLSTLSSAINPDHPMAGAYDSSSTDARGPPPSYGGPPPPPPADGPPPEGPPGPPPPPTEGSDPFDGHFGPHGRGGNHHHHHPHHHRGGHGWGGCGGGWGAWGGRGGWGTGRGRCGGRGPFMGGGGGQGMMGGAPFDMSKLGEFIAQFGGSQGAAAGAARGFETGGQGEENFVPEADIFDTESEFVIHVSLPGAKKEDVGVNWDADASELSIAGVIYRPGDEELLKCLAVDGRRVGVFESKVQLGTKSEPASVETDGITAKMEEGVLVVRVPKVEKFVEIRKVDVE